MKIAENHTLSFEYFFYVYVDNLIKAINRVIISYFFLVSNMS